MSKAKANNNNAQVILCTYYGDDDDEEKWNTKDNENFKANSKERKKTTKNDYNVEMKERRMMAKTQRWRNEYKWNEISCKNFILNTIISYSWCWSDGNWQKGTNIPLGQ